MNSLYALAAISRQGHFDAMKRASEQEARALCYLGFIDQIREDHPGMGLRRIHEQFSPEGIGRDSFVALGLTYGYRLSAPPPKPERTTYAYRGHRYGNLLSGSELTDVNQAWVSDLFYFPLRDRHYYVVLIMDLYSRRILGFSVAENMRAENTVAALRLALSVRGIAHYCKKLIHHSDRGSQYISDAYTALLESSGIRISMCIEVLENAHSERVNGTIKNGYLKRWIINSYSDLDTATQRAVTNYNDRLHDSLGMTPNQYEAHLKLVSLKDHKPMKLFRYQHHNSNKGQLELFQNN
jgi:transposase InsO family protein